MKNLIILSILLNTLAGAAQAGELRGDYHTDFSALPSNPNQPRENNIAVKWQAVIAKAKAPEGKGDLSGDAEFNAMTKIHYGWYAKGFSYIAEAAGQDYWKSPAEFRHDKGGDCEDWAIADYFAAVKAGIPENDLEIVIGWYLPFRAVHSALRIRVDGEYFYFQGIGTHSITEAEYLKEFTPYWGMNRFHWEKAQ